MTNCTLCGKEIFNYNVNSVWMRNVSKTHYHEGCRKIAANERARLRLKQKRELARIAKESKKAPELTTEPSKPIKIDKMGIIETMPDKPFMTDSEWWDSENYKKLSKMAKMQSGKMKV